MASAALRSSGRLGFNSFVGEAAPVTTQRVSALQTSYVAAGDWTDSRSFTRRAITSWYWLSGVGMRRERETRAIVTLGDSITAGSRSTVDVNARWPDFLARRLLACRRDLTVVNMGIGGNRVLNEEIGPNAQPNDAAHPLVFNPACDSGDHLHPGDAGHEVMANAIDLALFRDARGRAVACE